jgi:hypothetical protein
MAASISQIMRAIGVACVAVLILPLGANATPAFGYRDVGLDPDDRRPIGYDPDLRSTARKVWASPDGQRFLTIQFSAYEDLGVYWGVFVYLDSRAGVHRDYVMSLSNADNGGKGCEIRERGHSWDAAKDGKFFQGVAVAKCRIPLKWVHRTKRIRWRLVSPSGYVHGNVDIAPNDRGWYA